ncbi:MAG TPA: glycosyltransferase family 9 protein [Candidatus Didemnitutus sp.]|nr:glycosyltransferase family 9 protein [Candidatus Didemnitutus sp.]
MPELLVIQPSSLGDIAHGLQVVAVLKAQQPDWRVSWIVRDIFAPLVRASTVVDQSFVFQRHEGARAFLRLMREVRRKQFDVVFDFQGLLRSGLMTKWSHATRKAGRTDAREGSGIFYDERAPLPAAGRQAHPLEILLQFCTLVGARPQVEGPLAFREMDRLNLDFMEPRRGVRPVLMFPDSRREDLKWGGYAAFSSMLVREMGRKVVWAGAAYLPCREAFPDGTFVNLTGNTSLTSLAAIMQRADWVIANDSGALHLAAALQVRTLGMFGPTDPVRHGPWPLNSPTNFVIQAPVGDLRLLSAKDAFARFQKIEQVTLSRSR